MMSLLMPAELGDGGCWRNEEFAGLDQVADRKCWCLRPDHSSTQMIIGLGQSPQHGTTAMVRCYSGCSDVA